MVRIIILSSEFLQLCYQHWYPYTYTSDGSESAGVQLEWNSLDLLNTKRYCYFLYL